MSETINDPVEEDEIAWSDEGEEEGFTDIFGFDFNAGDEVDRSASTSSDVGRCFRPHRTSNVVVVASNDG